ncbi:hypothetical protein DSO57_1004015 [Entomophthora muscae]|uniref:Uncharacterized protein n=1 Tax=Entomophthora muscae TaxID=34485 RepID=A0ACC2SL68_9FUNG|nr:hypothetical protein DSO57_1004015 [Entomophthora muscae]
MCYKFEYKTYQLVPASTQEIYLFYPPKYFQTCLQTIRSCSQSRVVIQLGSEKPEAKQLNFVELVLAGKPILNNYVKRSKQDNLKPTKVPVPGSNPKHQLVPSTPATCFSQWFSQYYLNFRCHCIQKPQDYHQGNPINKQGSNQQIPDLNLKPVHKYNANVVKQLYDVKPIKWYYTSEILMPKLKHEYGGETRISPRSNQ